MSIGAKCALLLAPFVATGALADTTQVRLSNLQDVSLPQLNPSLDARSTQNDCVYSGTPTRSYTIVATGSGSGSAFSLSAGPSLPELPYSVQWSASAGQTSGTQLSPGIVQGGLGSNATNINCSSGPSASASLILRFDASDLEAAAAGIAYQGTLTLVIGPE